MSTRSPYSMRLADKFDVSLQIVPAQLSKLLSDKVRVKPERVVQAMLQ